MCTVFVGGWDDANKKITVNILAGHYWPTGREVSKDLWIGYFTPPGEKISWCRNMKMQNHIICPKDRKQLWFFVKLSSSFSALFCPLQHCCSPLGKWVLISKVAFMAPASATLRDSTISSLVAKRYFAEQSGFSECNVARGTVQYSTS